MVIKSIYYRQPYLQTLIFEVKNPLKEALEIIFDPKANLFRKAKAGRECFRILRIIQTKLPEPTVANTKRESSHILIGIRDRFFGHVYNFPMLGPLRQAINLIIMVNDTDFYSPFILWWLWEIKKSDLPPMGPHQPDPHHWKEEA